MILWLLLLFPLLLLAQQQQQQQQPLLEKKINLHCINEPLEQVLARLQKQYGLDFAYSDDVVPVKAAITLSMEQKPLKLLLEKLQKDFAIDYKVLQHRIVLTRLPASLTQTIRGQVLDQSTGAAIPGASVLLAGSSPPQGSITDGSGYFKIEGAAVGRATLLISSLGYQPRLLPGLLVGTAKELVLEVRLAEAVHQLDEVVVTAAAGAAHTQLGYPLLSARSFSVEESKRFAGSLGDPARMAANFAGVSGGNDESNALVIRGNSPRGLLWRIEGIEVPNPNHFSTEGASSGVVSVLSANVLDRADFLTGAFPAVYGNALSGVFDLRLRNGNNRQREHSLQLGMLGMEVSTEGPFARKSQASYLLNYRYSTLSLLDRAGFDLNRAGEFKDYQDLAFKLYFPAGRLGTFSVFGIGGLSRSNHADTSMLDNSYSNMGVLGLNHQKEFKGQLVVKSAFSLSGTHISGHDRLLSLSDRVLQLDEDYKKTYARIATSVSKRFSARHAAEGGFTYSRLFYSFYLRDRDSQNVGYDNIVNFQENGGAGAGIVQSYLQAKSVFAPRLGASSLEAPSLEVVYGMHFLYFGLTGDYSLEPRLGLRWQATGDKLFSAGFGKHSKTENLQYYLGRDHQKGGREVQLNRELGFTRALHYVLGYEQSLPFNTLLKLETYYQQLYNAPVQLNPANLYAAINEDTGFVTDTLINKGTGRNMGVELSLEKSFSKNFYYLLNGSLFDSRFRMADGRTWNTTYNGNYSVHALGGYERAVGAGKKGLLGLNLKLSWAGGRRYIPIDAEASVLEGRQVYLMERAFEPRLPDYFRSDVQLSYRRHHAHYTSEWRLDIQNITNHRNAAYYYYNAGSKEVKLKKQIGLLPILSYRIEF